jgi:acyl carrier protein
MERNEMFEKVRGAILHTSPDLDPDEVTETSSFQTLGLDSLKFVELGVWVEQIFGEKILLDDWVDQESLKGSEGFTMSSFLDFIDRSLAS